MMLLHCTTSISTFGAHPHHPERLPNLDLLVRAHPRILMDRMLPWMVRTPHLGYLSVVHQSFCCVQSARNSCDTHFLAVLWVPMLLCSTFL